MEDLNLKYFCYKHTEMSLRVCLVKYGGWKTLEREWEGKLFGVYLVRWGGKKINCGIQVFSLQSHQKVLSPKWRENRERKAHEMSFQKYPLNSPPSLQRVVFF